MISTKMPTETTHVIQGPAGQLELAIGEPTAAPQNAWGIVCHPHSLHGGTMYNKVVTTLVKAFQGLGLSTVRFNFRGVMGSGGQFDNGHGEAEDLLAVIDWVQHEQLKSEIWLAGFSFGAYVAAKVATQIPVGKLVTVAPPVVNFPMQSLPPITCPWVLAQGEADDVVAASDVYAWVATRDPQPIVLSFPTAGHFFHGQLSELRARIEEALQ